MYADLLCILLCRSPICEITAHGSAKANKRTGHKYNGSSTACKRFRSSDGECLIKKNVDLSLRCDNESSASHRIYIMHKTAAIINKNRINNHENIQTYGVELINQGFCCIIIEPARRIMRIERINDNSIRCTLTSFDLSVRNLNIRELAYGSEKARKLFDEMMNKASNEVGFNAENMPIMIEAVPMSSDSIQLIISKVANPEELDTRFSRFTQNPAFRKEAENWINKLASALLEGADGLAAQLKANGTAPGTQDKPQAPGQPGQQAEIAPGEFRAFAFDKLDEVIKACRSAGVYTGESKLYKSLADGHYVLVITVGDADKDEFARACNVAAEYGRMVKTVQDSEAYYDEHYKLIADNAVTKLGQL